MYQQYLTSKKTYVQQLFNRLPAAKLLNTDADIDITYNTTVSEKEKGSEGIYGGH